MNCPADISRLKISQTPTTCFVDVVIACIVKRMYLSVTADIKIRQTFVIIQCLLADITYLRFRLVLAAKMLLNALRHAFIIICCSSYAPQELRISAKSVDVCNPVYHQFRDAVRGTVLLIHPAQSLLPIELPLWCRRGADSRDCRVTLPISTRVLCFYSCCVAVTLQRSNSSFRP